MTNTIRIVFGACAALVCAAGAAFAADAPASEAKPAASLTLPSRANFDPDTYKGETGKFILPLDGPTMSMLYKVVDGKPADMIQPHYKDGIYTLPVGKYKMLFCNITVTGKNGEKWTVIPVIEEEFEVKAGATTKLVGGQELANAIKSGKTGKIKLPYSGEGSSLMLASVENGKLVCALSAEAKNGVATVPCGKYQLVSCNTAAADKAGKKWLLSISYGQDKPQVLDIKAGSEIKVGSGEPYTASIDVKQDGDKVTMSLKTVNAKGETCSIRSLDQAAETPGFQVVDKSGQVVMSGKFQYG